MIKVIISDDIKIIRDSIEIIVSKMENIEIVGKTNNYKEEINLIKKYKPNVIITDTVKNREGKTFEIIKSFTNSKWNPKFLLVTGMDKEDINYQILKYKLNNNNIGYVQKPFSKEDIVKAIENLL